MHRETGKEDSLIRCELSESFSSASSSSSLQELPLSLPSSIFFLSFFSPTTTPLGSGGVLKIVVLPFDGLIGISSLLFISSSATHQSEADRG